MKKKMLAFVAAIGFVMGASAHAELVNNGGFETGDFAGWAVSSGFTAVSTASFDEGVHSGSYAAFLGQVGSLGSISQTISTQAGSSYDFSFWYANDGGTPNAFEAYFDNQLLFSAANDRAHGYEQHDFIVTASSDSTVINFRGRNDPGYLALDDVSVNSAAVPEPTTTALLGLGLLGAFAASRRNSSKSKNA